MASRDFSVGGTDDYDRVSTDSAIDNLDPSHVGKNVIVSHTPEKPYRLGTFTVVCLIINRTVGTFMTPYHVDILTRRPRNWNFQFSWNRHEEYQQRWPCHDFLVHRWCVHFRGCIPQHRTWPINPHPQNQWPGRCCAS